MQVLLYVLWGDVGFAIGIYHLLKKIIKDNERPTRYEKHNVTRQTDETENKVQK